MLKSQCKKRLVKLCKVYAAVGLIGISLSVVSYKLGFGIPCIFHMLTGLNCPSCGITRMFAALLHGDFYTAYSLNRLMFISLPLFAFYIVKCSACYVKYGKCIFSKADNAVFIVFIVCAIVFGFVRNVDVMTNTLGKLTVRR